MTGGRKGGNIPAVQTVNLTKTCILAYLKHSHFLPLPALQVSQIGQIGLIWVQIGQIGPICPIGELTGQIEQTLSD